MNGFSCCVGPPNYMVDSRSVVGVTSGDSSLVIQYQVDNFNHTQSADHFVAAQPQAYSRFRGKVQTLAHFPLDADCEDYTFLDQAVKDFEQGVYSILMNSIKVS